MVVHCSAISGPNLVARVSPQAHEGAGLSFFIEQFIEFLQFMLFVVNHVCIAAMLHTAFPVCPVPMPCYMQRAHFAWTTTISPLQYAAHFSVPAGYYEVAHSPSFYLALLCLAGEALRDKCS